MPIWTVKSAHEKDVQAIAQTLKLPTAIARIFWLRGHKTPEDAQQFLAGRNASEFWKTPLKTPQVQKAVKRIHQALDTQEHIAIYGDYDCDGVTSTSLLYRYLKRGQEANLRAYLPDRFKDGYGITPEAIDRLANDGATLVITCDNGISAHAAIERAKQLNIDVIVTDHHTLPDELPDCYAIVHPQLEFPLYKDLAGVGVAYLLTIALEGSFTPRMEHLMDFATIGTIADVVSLAGPNRSMVWAGIERFRQGKCLFPGIKALAKVSNIDLDTLSAQDIGFRIGPRLNAAGRLEHPDIGFKLLSTNDTQEAQGCAFQLDTINRQRQELTEEWRERLFEIIDSSWDLEKDPFIVLSDPNFHHGITGILAGNIKDRYRVPVLLFSGEEGAGETPWKASGRSPEGLHLYEALHACQGHLLGFGGHSQAAGCSARLNSIPLLKEALNEYVKKIGWQRPPDMVWIDAILPFEEANEVLLEALDLLEPFGQHNPMPVFGLLHARIVSRRVRGKHLFLKVDDGHSIAEVIAWNQGDIAPTLGDWIHLTYTPGISEYQGIRKVAFTANRLDPCDPPPPVKVEIAQEAQIRDLRNQDPVSVMAQLTEPFVIYGEPSDPSLPFIGPLDNLSSSLEHLVMLECPHNEASWLVLQQRARQITQLWDDSSETPLTPEWLLSFYEGLSQYRDFTLKEAVSQIKAPWHASIDALAIFKEAGILVEGTDFWTLLAPPPHDIELWRLQSFQDHLEAQSFRRRLKDKKNLYLTARMA